VGNLDDASRARIASGTEVSTGVSPTLDPYAKRPDPVFSGGRWTLGDLVWTKTGPSSQPGCDHDSVTIKTALGKPLGPNNANALFVICGELSVSNGMVVTLTPGIYIFDGALGGALKVTGGTLTGNQVTLVFTSRTPEIPSSFATASITGNPTINFDAPNGTSHPTRGIVIYSDRRSTKEFSFLGGASQVLAGAIYVPNGHVKFGGGAQTTDKCTQLVADHITFSGDANFKIGCLGTGMEDIDQLVSLVE